jgi:hypothetical protein
MGGLAQPNSLQGQPNSLQREFIIAPGPVQLAPARVQCHASDSSVSRR